MLNIEKWPSNLSLENELKKMGNEYKQNLGKSRIHQYFYLYPSPLVSLIILFWSSFDHESQCIQFICKQIEPCNWTSKYSKTEHFYKMIKNEELIVNVEKWLSVTSHSMEINSGENDIWIPRYHPCN